MNSTKPSDRLKRIHLLDPTNNQKWDDAGIKAKLKTYVIADKFITFSERLMQGKKIPPTMADLFRSLPRDQLKVAYETALMITLQPDGSHPGMTTLEIEFVGGKHHAGRMGFHIKPWGRIEQVACTWNYTA